MADDGGLARFQARMRAIPQAVRLAVQPALVQGAEEIAEAARVLAESSRDTGGLIDSIAVTPPGGLTPRGATIGGVRRVPENAAAVTAGNGEVRYAHLVEFGTREAVAQPFFWPAYRLARKRVTNRIKRAIGKAIRESRR